MRIQKIVVLVGFAAGLALASLITATGADAQVPTCNSLGPTDLVQECDGKADFDLCCLNDDQCTDGICRPDAGNNNILTCQIRNSGQDTQCPADDVTCTDDRCDGNGNCVHPPVNERCSAGDGQCEESVCDPDALGADADSGCVTNDKPNDTPCDDTDVCTVNDTCQGGACQSGPLNDCTASDSDCAFATCDTTEDAANCNGAQTPKPNDTPCDDGNICTVNDSCQGGTCQSGPLNDCTASDSDCASATCDTTEDAPNCNGPQTPKPNDTPCDDSNVCTVNDSCQGGTCQSGPLNDCTASDTQCASATCDTTQDAPNCSGTPTPKPDDTPCDDSDVCTVGESCQGGICRGGTQNDCSGFDTVCGSATCDPAGTEGNCGGPVIPKPDEDPCDDGNVCTQGDLCIGGLCQPGPEFDCSDLDTACSEATCDSRFVALNCNGAPIPKDDGTPCDDGTTCTPIDVCQRGECVGVGCGDPNRDGKKSLADCLDIIYSALLGQRDCPLDACDLNGNCRVDITDALGCLHCAVGLESCAWFQKCPIPIGFPIYATDEAGLVGQPDTQTPYADFLAGINYSKAPGEFCSRGRGHGIGPLPRLTAGMDGALAPGGELICETLVNPDDGCRPQGAYPDDGETVLPTVTTAFCPEGHTFKGPTLARCFFLQAELARMDVCDPAFDLPAAFQVLDAEGFGPDDLPPVTVCPVAGPRCGNRICDALYEGSLSCSSECFCGDALCDLDETFASCPADCTIATCGDGVCESLEETVGCPFDCSSLQPSSTPPCLPPSDWTCNPGFYGTDDICDCGCGAFDPGCEDSTSSSCDECDFMLSCADSICSEIDPFHNARCVSP